MPRVLIVDDDKATREVLREALEEEGYEVAEASDGLGCLEALRTSQEGIVVLLDQLMPRLDGVGVLRAVRDEPSLASRHVYVLLTARTRISTPIRELAAALAVPVVRKPFDLETLFQVIDQASRRLEKAAG